MTAIAHAGYMTGRHMRAMARQPWYIALTLVQPMIYLLLFGALFEKATLIPGFEGDSYLAFLTPGIVVMSALFSAAWNGMATLEDLERGTIDRFLVTPVSRAALIAGPIAQAAAVVMVQSLIIVGVATVRGASYDGGVVGIAVMLLASVLLAVPFAAFSNAVALTSRSREAMIGSVQFIALPLTFLAAGFMPIDLAPGWIQGIARFNPVNWAVEAARAALAVEVDWSFVLVRLGWLALLAAVMGWLATGAFRAYQKTI